MSVKTIVYSSDDDDSRYFPEFASHQKSRKFAEDIEYFKTKDINDENVVNLNEGRFSMATSKSVSFFFIEGNYAPFNEKRRKN